MSIDILELQPDSPSAQKPRKERKVEMLQGEGHPLAGSATMWPPNLFIAGAVLVGFKPTSLTLCWQ